MLEEGLVASIRTYVECHSGLRVVPDDDTSALALEAAGRFAIDRKLRWWWQGLSAGGRLAYSGQGGLRLLDRMLQQHAGDLIMVITDDELPPWLAVSGRWECLRALLEEHQFFEFFLLDRRVDWLVFDTHENALVFVGEPPNRDALRDG